MPLKDEQLALLQVRVARNLCIVPEQVRQAFSTDSESFYHELVNVSTKYKDWTVVRESLDKARAVRHMYEEIREPDEGDWTVNDAEHATEILEDKYFRSIDSCIQVVPKTWTLTPAISAVQSDTGIKNVHIIMCCITEPADIGLDGGFVRIPIPLGQPSGGSRETRLLSSQTEIEALRRMLGRGLVSFDVDEQLPVIHQAIITALAAKNTGRLSIELHNWDWAKRQTRQDTLHNYIQAISANRITVWLPCSGSNWATRSSFERFYEQVTAARLLHKTGSLTVYPSQEESRDDGLKITDIKAFDAIAGARDCPVAFSYRPKTCFGRGECRMADWRHRVKKMVLKRTYSDSSNHVIIGSSDNNELWNRLCCTFGQVPVVPQPGSELGNSGPVDVFWFHQQYIDTLRSYGEIRVFVCGDSIPAIAFTKWQDDGRLVCRRFNPDKDLLWYSTEREERLHKLRELEAFCLYVRAKLLELPGPSFESLRVGARFDVGVSELSNRGRFFINEVTRWNNADYMSDHILDAPYDKICRALGERFADLYGEKME
ncbi:hypothetical protein FDECE_1832 [Fusarium decemcellulare]|nr:hypothetical protein FDECE_1832 [Fusarium decemcellulare]